jgi:hypothetical protein
MVASISSVNLAAFDFAFLLLCLFVVFAFDNNTFESPAS